MGWRDRLGAAVGWGSTLIVCAVGVAFAASGRVRFDAGYATKRPTYTTEWVTPCVERSVSLESGVLVFSQAGDPPTASGEPSGCWASWRHNDPDQAWVWMPRWGWDEWAIGAYAPVYNIYVPLWVFAGAAGLPAAGLWVMNVRRRRRRARGSCLSCAYDRRGLAA